MKIPSFFGILLLISGGVQAQEEPRFSITLSPVHLALPVGEFMGEFALSPKVSLAGILGFGKISDENYNGEDTDIPVFELGAQAAYYALGSFRHGLQVGAEVLWIKVSLPEDEGVTAAANGIAVGPLVGYKWVSRLGFTTLIQVGYQALFAQAEAKDSSGQEVEGSVEDDILLLNLNVGWSF